MKSVAKPEPYDPERDARGSAQSFSKLRDSLSKDPAAIRNRIENMERLLERSMTIPGTNKPIGLDAVASVIPVVGDLIAAALGSYIIWEARNLGMSKFQLARMAANIGIDTTIGSVPVLGTVFDYFYRSNTKNLRIVKKHLEKHHPAALTIEG